MHFIIPKSNLGGNLVLPIGNCGCVSSMIIAWFTPTNRNRKSYSYSAKCFNVGPLS